MSEYTKLVSDTREMTQRMALKWDVISCILIALMALLAIIGLRLIWEEHRERKEAKLHQVVGGDVYRPQVLPDVQIGPDGTEFHRMGIPGKEV